VAVLALFAGCPSKDEAPQKPSKSAAELMAEAMVGPGDECKAHSDCASDVCQDGFCSALSEASQPWMEARIARKLARTPGGVEALFDTWVARFESEDPFARGRLAGMLGHLGDERARPLLRAWAKSPIERVRVRATLALGRMADATAYKAIEELLDHRSESVALDATDTLVHYGRKGDHKDDALALLVELAEDPRYRVRQRAVVGMGEVGRRTHEVVKLLQALTTADADGYLVHDARRALTLCQ